MNTNKKYTIKKEIKEEILDLGKKVFLIDWECGGVDIPETDIGNLFAGCKLSKRHQRLFLDTYCKNSPSH